MAFRYLIYRTDFDNTIVRESATNNPDSGQHEASFYTDFIIPEIQPLYLWRINDGITDVEPNTDENINDWLAYNAPPPEPEDDATVGYVTGITSQKIDKVTGATGNLGQFTTDGNLEDSGLSISDITGVTDGYVTNEDFTGYTATTDTRLDGIESDITYISGVTDTKLDESDFTGYTATTDTRLGDIEQDIADLSGVTDNKIDKVTGATDNLGVFTSNGNLRDTGYTIDDILSGSTGSGGGDGMFTAEFTLISGTTDSKPGAGNIKLNNSSPSNTTIIYVDNVDKKGDNVGDFYASLQKDEFISLRDKVNSNTTYIFEVTADSEQTATDNTGYVKVHVSSFIINGTINYNSGIYAGIQYDAFAGENYITEDTFTGYTATTDTRLDGIDNDITYISGVTDTKLDESDFNQYTGDTDTRLDGIDNDITYISGQTDLKLDRNDFVVYTAATDTRLDTIEQDVTDLQNDKLDESVFNQYTGDTDTRLDDIEQDISDISGVTVNAVTGGTNGLTKDGRNLKLGGTLSENTTISGTSDLNIDINQIDLKASSDIVIESNGDIDINGLDSSDVAKFKLKINENGGVITDDSTQQHGLKYATDYSSTFDARSLIDKAYVDAVASGLDAKESVRVATTGETIDISGGTFGGIIDGITLQNNDRVLIKNQSNAVENGVYVYNSSANDFSRSADFVNPYVTPGAFMFVETGSTNSGTGWVVLESGGVSDIDVGTDPINFSKFSHIAEYTAGVGIDINVNEISVDGVSLAGNSISWSGNTFNVDPTNGDLKDALDEKLDITDFDSYSAATDTRLGDIEQDITDLETKVDGQYDIFTGYTASTTPNELFLIHTGGTNMNVTSGVNIVWHTEITKDSAYSWSSESITILEAGDYELSYNIPYIQETNDRDVGIGSNIILTRGTNTEVIDLTSAAEWTSRDLSPANLALPPVILTFQANDVIKLFAFRAAKTGQANTVINGNILIKKKNTLQ